MNFITEPKKSFRFFFLLSLMVHTHRIIMLKPLVLDILFIYREKFIAFITNMYPELFCYLTKIRKNGQRTRRKTISGFLIIRLSLFSPFIFVFALEKITQKSQRIFLKYV